MFVAFGDFFQPEQGKIPNSEVIKCRIAKSKAVISYYLQNREEVENYLEQRKVQASNCANKSKLAAIRKASAKDFLLAAEKRHNTGSKFITNSSRLLESD
jgi:hypothetical protein